MSELLIKYGLSCSKFFDIEFYVRNDAIIIFTSFLALNTPLCCYYYIYTILNCI